MEDVESCSMSLQVKDKIYEKYNYLQNLNLNETNYDQKKHLHYQMVTHEIKVLTKKSITLFTCFY